MRLGVGGELAELAVKLGTAPKGLALLASL